MVFENGFVVLDQKTNNGKEEWAMTTKKISFLVAVFVLASLLMVNVASAAWYICSVNRVGGYEGGFVVYLTDTSTAHVFTDRYFYLDASHEKEYLALAITAYVNGKRLYVNLLPSNAAGSIVKVLYMMD